MPLPPSLTPRGRHSFRLQGFDYSQTGAYFFTTVVHNRVAPLSLIIKDQVVPTQEGIIILKTWSDLPGHYPRMILDEFVVMPNHVHSIILLENSSPIVPDEKTSKPAGLPEIIRAFKSFSARRINVIRQTPGIPFWQRNYYERVIRNEREMDRDRLYILKNPLQWYDNQVNGVGAGL